MENMREPPVICEGCGLPAYGKPARTEDTVNTPQDLYALAKDLANLTREHLRVIVLNTKNQVITSVDLYRGSVNTSVARPAEVFGCAVKLDAPALAVVHNHPSGDPTPSSEDVELTRRLVAGGRVLDIEVVDHVVIGSDGRYLSMRERALGFD